MERAEVFEATHRLVLSIWRASGAIDGLRIDHPDGLADPAGLLRAAAAALRASMRGCRRGRAVPRAAVRRDREDRRAARAAARRLGGARHHRLPLRQRGQRAVRRRRGEGAARPCAGARSCATRPRTSTSCAGAAASIVMAGALAGELSVLAAALLRLAREDRRTRDFTLNALRRALAEVVASFPVYRTYVVDEPSAQDRRHDRLGRRASRAGAAAAADASVFDFIRRVLLGSPPPARAPGLAERLPRLRAPAAAVHRAGGGQGHRGHRAVPAPAAGLAERRRRRPRRLRHHGDGLPRAPAATARCTGRTRMLATLDARQQALGGRARAHRRDQRDAGGVAPDGAPLEPAEPQPQAPGRRQAGADRATTSTCCTRRWSAACRPARSTARRSPLTRSASSRRC